MFVTTTTQSMAKEEFTSKQLPGTDKSLYLSFWTTEQISKLYEQLDNQWPTNRSTKTARPNTDQCSSPLWRKVCLLRPRTTHHPACMHVRVRVHVYAFIYTPRACGEQHPRPSPRATSNTNTRIITLYRETHIYMRLRRSSSGTAASLWGPGRSPVSCRSTKNGQCEIDSVDELKRWSERDSN